jgi:hypothetical protein
MTGRPRLYRKKPVVIEAVRWFGAGHWEALPQWAKDAVVSIDKDGVTLYINVDTGGIGEIKPGTWLLKGVRGEVYPCLDDIFMETYEYVGDVNES